VLADRAQREAAARHDLGRAGSSRSQAAVAAGAGRVQAAFARRARRLPAPPVARAANAAIASAIGRIGRGYERLSTAARDHDAAAYSAAGAAVRGAEARLTEAVGTLKLLGYDIPGGA
jgi:hypothetical protein